MIFAWLRLDSKSRDFRHIEKKLTFSCSGFPDKSRWAVPGKPHRNYFVYLGETFKNLWRRKWLVLKNLTLRFDPFYRKIYKCIRTMDHKKNNNQKLLSWYNEEYKSVLPMRFCEKVGFFSGTDKVTASLGGESGMLPWKILKIAMQIAPFYSIWARIHYFFLAENRHA